MYSCRRISYYDVVHNAQSLLSAFQSQLCLTPWTKDLSVYDRCVLRDNGWLSANHISAANKLMLKAFPHQNGLQDTHYLAKKMYWPSIPKNFVQIIHVGDCHWACLSNKFSEDNTVELYDTLFTKPGDTIQEQVSTIMNCEMADIGIQVMNVVPQQSGHSCGLYAIAVAVDLCLGNDPCSSLYDEEQMRNHSELCFNKQVIIQFPQQFHKASHRVLNEIRIPVYCICRYPDCTTCFGDMVCCDMCGEWYHEHCLRIKDIKALKKLKWFCFRCDE